jgi:hypothetical protein
VNWLDRVATTISSFRDADRFFLTLSFVGWDYFDSREQTVPTPALFVSPNWNVELASLTVRRPQTERGLRLQGWFEDLNRSDLCVAESVRNPDPPPRVFLGYRSASKFRSIGSFMSPAELT